MEYKKTLESDIQKRIKKYLKDNGIYNERSQAGINEINKPDIMVIHNGKVAFLELKTPEGRASRGQELKRERLLRAGALHIYPTCLDDVKKLIKEMES